MSENSVAEEAIKNLKSRLESAINARGEIENEFSAQSALLTSFIDKLSQACKGTDVLLDNKLAKLRATIKKSICFTVLEKEIETISTLLQKHSVQNDQNIIKIHEQLNASSTGLQKVKNFSKENRRQLQTLIKKIEQSQSSLIQYIPIMSEFIACYENIIHQQISKPTEQSLTPNKSVALNKINKVDTNEVTEKNSVTDQVASRELVVRFSSILNTLVISKKHKADITKIKSSLHSPVSNQILMTNCLNVFDFMIEDIAQERSRAKVFLSTLSETLTSVQVSVSATISSSAECSVQNAKINKELSDKINEVSIGIIDAGSLTEMKRDVNEKIQQIAKALENKTNLEEKQRLALHEELNNMSSKIEQLEQQSKIFEKRIQEVQAKSFQDSLTKLANRAAFDEFFAKEIVRYHHKQFDLAITVIDLDDFKRINDTYGHTAGDKTLQVIADTLTKVMGEDIFISRYGGEEFVLIFKETDKITVMNKLNILRKKVASLPFTFKGNRVSITLSIGITLVQRDDNVHSAFERADTALYQAKNDGKNKVVYG